MRVQLDSSADASNSSSPSHFYPFAGASLPSQPRALLFPQALHPSADLVAIISHHVVAAQSSTQSAPPPVQPKLSVAQLRLREMAAKRAAAAAGGGRAAGVKAGDAQRSVEPRRGTPLRLSLWRTGDSSSQVWDVPIVAPPELFSGSTVQEEERAQVTELCWEPYGHCLIVSVHLTRYQPAGPSTSSDIGRRDARGLIFYSVHDGRQVAVVSVDNDSSDAVARRSRIKHLEWINCDVPTLAKPSSTGATTLISQLAPLPPLPEPNADAKSATKLMPHQRQQQAMRGGAQAPAWVSRTEQATAGRGALSRIPTTLRERREDAPPPAAPAKSDPKGKRPVDGNPWETPRASQANENDEPDRPGEVPKLDLLVAWDQSGKAHVFLDGSVPLGSTSVAGTDGHLFLSAVTTPHTLESLILYKTDTPSSPVRLRQAQLPLLATPSRTRPNLLPATRHIATLSTSLRTHLAYALDASRLLAYLGVQDPVRGYASAAREWARLLDDSAGKYSRSPQADLVRYALLGTGSDVVDAIMDRSVTANVLQNIERTTRGSLRDMARIVEGSLMPALERTLLLLSELGGACRWPERYGSLLSSTSSPSASTIIEGLKSLATNSAVRARRVRELADAQRLAFDEFFNWWKWCIKLREQDPALQAQQNQHPEARNPVRHDVLTVVELLHVGLNNNVFESLLGDENGAAKQADLGEAKAKEKRKTVEQPSIAAAVTEAVADMPVSAQAQMQSVFDMTRKLLQADLIPSAAENVDAQANFQAPTAEQTQWLFDEPRIFAGALGGDSQDSTSYIEDSTPLTALIEKLVEGTATLLDDALRRVAPQSVMSEMIDENKDCLLSLGEEDFSLKALLREPSLQAVSHAGDVSPASREAEEATRADVGWAVRPISAARRVPPASKKLIPKGSPGEDWAGFAFITDKYYTETSREMVLHILQRGFTGARGVHHTSVLLANVPDDMPRGTDTWLVKKSGESLPSGDTSLDVLDLLFLKRAPHEASHPELFLLLRDPLVSDTHPEGAGPSAEPPVVLCTVALPFPPSDDLSGAQDATSRRTLILQRAHPFWPRHPSEVHTHYAATYERNNDRDRPRPLQVGEQGMNSNKRSAPQASGAVPAAVASTVATATVLHSIGASSLPARLALSSGGAGLATAATLSSDGRTLGYYDVRIRRQRKSGQEGGEEEVNMAAPSAEDAMEGVKVELGTEEAKDDEDETMMG